MMILNTIMCMDVVMLLTPLHQGMLRSAGQRGIAVFEELVSIDKIPIYVETSIIGWVGSEVVHAPIVPYTPSSLSSDEGFDVGCVGAVAPINDEDTTDNSWASATSNTTTAVVVSHTAMMALRGGMVVDALDQIRGVPTGHLALRYIHPTSSTYRGSNNSVSDDDYVGVEVDEDSEEYFSEDMEQILATSIELCGFESVNKVLNHFLVNANAISTLDIAPLQFVTSIGDDFLFNCSSLTSINLAPLGAVVSIGASFLGQCSSLLTLDTTPLLQSLMSIESGFLGDCCSLHDVDLTGLGNLQALPSDFLTCCTALQSIDLAPLGGTLTAIEDRFMFRCMSVVTVDIAPLTHLKSIGCMFMAMCSALTTFGNPGTTVHDTLLRLETVSDNFLYTCESLVSVNLSVLSNLTAVSHMFLCSCSSLTTIDVSPLRHATTIEHSFLSNCTSLTDIDISVLWRAELVGAGFLFGCKGVRDSGVQGRIGEAFRASRQVYETSVPTQ